MSARDVTCYLDELDVEDYFEQVELELIERFEDLDLAEGD